MSVVLGTDSDLLDTGSELNRSERDGSELKEAELKKPELKEPELGKSELDGVADRLSKDAEVDSMDACTDSASEVLRCAACGLHRGGVCDTSIWRTIGIFNRIGTITSQP